MMISIENKMSGFSEIVLVSKPELEALQKRVIDLININNQEIEKRRKAEELYKQIKPIKVDFDLNITKSLINTIIGIIRLADKKSESNGSCGDGSYDNKQKYLDHQDRMAAIRVLNQDLQDYLIEG